eukprot:4410946-Pyramimonas_sp.AAC.1
MLECPPPEAIRGTPKTAPAYVMHRASLKAAYELITEGGYKKVLHVEGTQTCSSLEYVTCTIPSQSETSL